MSGASKRVRSTENDDGHSARQVRRRTDYFDALPAEVLWHAMSLLDLNTLRQFAQLCARTNAILQDRSF
ncbi:Hypothetical protein UVM_LOCUS1, partial [uncultured virus]